MKRIFTALLIAVFVASMPCVMQGKTRKKTTRKKATTENLAGLTSLEKKVVGKHMLSLQWISWKNFGSVTITKEADGTLSCHGEQLAVNCADAEEGNKTNGDYVKLDGTIQIVDETHLIFTGDICEKVYHINNGEECLRQGTYDFIATGKRKYWRLQDITNPTGECADYIDIYFK